MESQYQDDLPVEWFEFTFSLPSELEMQMQDDYGDQGHIQQGYEMMATDYLQSPPTQEPQCAIATEGFINNFDLVHNFLPQDLGLFSTGLENYPMGPPNLESISPGVSTVTDWTLPSSSSSSDGYDGSANSPGLFTNALYGLPMTNMPVITSQSLVVAPVLLDNNITMTSNTGVGPQTLLEQQPYEQPSHVVTRASSQQLAGMSLPPETPSSSQPGIHRPPKKKTKRPTISERERRKKERPEKCPECDKGFPYVADLDRHIVARHEPEAPKYGLSTEKILCDLCLPSAAKSFARPDHLKRHKRRKHGKGRSRGPSLSSRSRSPTVKISGDSLALEGGRPALKRLRPRGS